MGTRTWRRMAMAVLVAIVVTSAACATDEMSAGRRYAQLDQQQIGTQQQRTDQYGQQQRTDQYGQQQQRTGDMGTRQMGQMGSTQNMQQVQFVSANEVIGQDVDVQGGRELGEVADIILDPSHTRAEYVLLDDDNTVIQWSDLTFQMGGDKGREVRSVQVRQGYTPQTLSSIQSGAMGRGMDYRTGTMRDTTGMRDQYTRDQTTRDQNLTGARDQTTRDQNQMTGARDQNMRDQNQNMGMRDQTMGTRSYGQMSMSDQNRLSHFIGLDLRARDDNEKNIGSIEDAIITSNDGRIVYGLASIDKGLLYREKEVAIPWNALSMSSRAGYARVDVNFNQLEALAFNQGELPDLSNRSYAQRVFGAFNEEPYYEVYGYGPTDMGADREKTWGKDSSYNKMYQKGEQTTVQGTVLSTGMYRPEGTSMEEGTRLRVRTDDGQIVVVHGGPKFFSSQQQMNLKVGDKVTIEGRKVTQNGVQTIMASSIKSGGKTWQLRDEQGSPMWKTGQMQPDRMGNEGRTNQWNQNQQNQAQPQTDERTRLQDQTTQERTRTQDQNRGY